jgi:predicted Zn-dependent peptidase
VLDTLQLYEKTTLDNGVRVVTSHMAGVRSASLIMYYNVGSRYEPPVEAGVSHFLEHMLFKGTERRPDPFEISQAIEGVGGIVNAATGRESTNYWCKVPSTHFALAFDVLADLVRNSQLDQREFEKERAVIIEEIRSVNDSPEDLINDLIDELVWGDQAIGRPIAGTEESVSAISRDGMADFWRRNYSPGRLVIAAAGDVVHDDVVTLAERYFGDLTSANPDGFESAHDDQTEPRVQVVHRDIEQTHICIAMPALPFTTERRYVQSTIEAILSSGMSSRLFQELREQRGLAYSVYAYFQPYTDVGQGVFYAGTDPDRADETISALMSEIRKIRDVRVPEDELQRTKDLRTGRLLMGMEDSRSLASWIGSQALTYGEIKTPEEVIEKIVAVTADEVQELAQEIFQENRISLAIVGPHDEDPEPFLKLLRA